MENIIMTTEVNRREDSLSDALGFYGNVIFEKEDQSFSIGFKLTAPSSKLFSFEPDKEIDMSLNFSGRDWPIRGSYPHILNFVSDKVFALFALIYQALSSDISYLLKTGAIYSSHKREMNIHQENFMIKEALFI